MTATAIALPIGVAGTSPAMTRSGDFAMFRGMDVAENMTTISVEPDVAHLINEAVVQGAFANASDAIRSALEEAKARRDDPLGYAPGELDRLIEEGIASGPGQDADFEAIKREARERAARLRPVT